MKDELARELPLRAPAPQAGASPTVVMEVGITLPKIAEVTPSHDHRR